MRFLYLFVLLAVAACGEEPSASLEVCETDPPFNAAYGVPDLETIREPAEPPHETIEYRWSCVAGELTHPDGDATAAYYTVSQTWQAVGNGCWIESGVNFQPDPRCGFDDSATDTTTP